MCYKFAFLNLWDTSEVGKNKPGTFDFCCGMVVINIDESSIISITKNYYN